MPGTTKSVREQVAIYAKGRPDRAATLDAVTPKPPPVAGAVACEAFAALSATRGQGMGGWEPLSLMAIDAYSRLVLPLSPRDVSLVMAMDATFMAEHARLAAHG